MAFASGISRTEASGTSTLPHGVHPPVLPLPATFPSMTRTYDKSGQPPTIHLSTRLAFANAEFTSRHVDPRRQAHLM
jgi:hypothetical protein